MILMDLLVYWHMELINYVLDFPQDLINKDIYIIPSKASKVFKMLDLQQKTYTFTKYTCCWKTYMDLRIMWALGLIDLKMDS